MDHRAVAHQAQEHLWTQDTRGLDWLRRRGLTDESIRKAMLGSGNGYINIPYVNPNGTVRLNRLRWLSGNIKYQTPKGGGVHIYGTQYTKEPAVWITEGEFDTLILRQMGMPSVAVPGAKAFKPAWKYLFCYTDQLTIVADGDTAGEAAAKRIAGLVGPVVNDVRIAWLPEGSDVNDLYLKDRAKLKDLVA